MHIVHKHKNKSADEHTNRPCAIFMTNKKGGYLSFGEKNFSHMQGLFFFDVKNFSPYKTIENITVNKKMTGLRNHLAFAERLYDETEESFSFFNNSVLYSVRNYTGDLTFELDFRHIFDYDDKGRIYTIKKEKDVLVVKYDKYADNSLSQKVYSKFLAIKGVGEFSPIKTWDKKSYSYDEKRGAKSEFYIYTAFSVPVSGSLNLVFSFGETSDEAIGSANVAFGNQKHYLASMKKYVDHTFIAGDVALDSAMKSLDDMIVTVGLDSDNSQRTGVFAGFPWFFQFWSRDELISLKALIIQHKFGLVKEILLNYLNAVSEEGLVPNRLPESKIRSIDASGWLFVRVHDLISELIRAKVVDDFLSEQDIKKMKSALERAIQGLTHYHAKDGFISGGLQESWMDTKEASRSGAFIESQAFILAMMRLHNSLAKATKSKQLFAHMEHEYADRVKKHFFKDGRLLDTLGGVTPGEIARPNVFLAYYIYPDLLSNEEWKKSFDYCIKELWLDWGGFASITHNSPSFRVEYTGERDLSYHNGDSWYFINNYAALAMLRLDRQYYLKHINRIYHASKEELLFSGFIGTSAELSSAKELRSEGCLSQAWSIASFIEFAHEFSHKSI